MRRLAAILCALILGISHGAATQTIPDRFVGVWKLIEGENLSCEQSDWTGNARTDTHIKITGSDVEFHEAQCHLISTLPGAEGDESGDVRLRFSCMGEGEEWQSTELWLLRKIDNVPILVMARTDSGNEFTSHYRRCSETNATAF